MALKGQLIKRASPSSVATRKSFEGQAASWQPTSTPCTTHHRCDADATNEELSWAAREGFPSCCTISNPVEDAIAPEASQGGTG